MARALRLAGWALIAAGGVVVLYVIYALGFTSLLANQAQAELRDQWQARLAAPQQDLAADDVDDQRRARNGSAPSAASRDSRNTQAGPDAGGEPAATADTAVGQAAPGDVVAMLEFDRPGTSEPPVHADPLFVVEGVQLSILQRGPGHYPASALPGGEGNMAVAGHRTTYGAPFYHLDQLRPGDAIRVTDRPSRQHTYEVVEQRVVDPRAAWVVDPDPLGTDTPTLTLTTCHPRFSAAQRLVVFATLAS